MKIQLPDPSGGTPEQWFAQMAIVLKAAQKMYQQMVKDHGMANPSEGGNNPWVLYKLDDNIQKDIENGKALDIDAILPTSLHLDIDHL